MWLQHVSMVKNGAVLAESGLEDILSKLFEAKALHTTEKLNPPDSILQTFKVFRNDQDLQRMLAYSYKVQGQLKYGHSVEEGKVLELRTVTLVTDSRPRQYFQQPSV